MPVSKLACLILVLAPSPALAQVRPDFFPQGLTVQGSATVKTPPDVATLKIRLRGDGVTADAASTDLANRQKAVIGGIASLDPKLNYHTGAVAIEEVRKGDCAGTPGDVDLDSMMASDAKEKDKGPCRVVGYVASIDATVEMRAIDKAATAIGLAGRLGASSASLDGFELRDPAAAKRAATAAAIADARTRADALATAAGAKLGPVVSILSGNDSPSMMAGMTDTMTTAAFDVAPQLRAPVVIDVSPKPVETSAQIVIVYALVK